ncbi:MULTISPECIES: carbohydrate ABC transporter permease [Paenibacillus]|uniref:carbohydrate ABC transporter permease n=1 Tax=Paenibacillus TaxID=44249 RepID=UPI0022B8D216|nr:sugar ABC transporter permease [Paenibacillus caseinilyticus]MCZ8520763.1 sugar ABC transporter permease [Paenibacillus caseinilyticus]
MTTSQRSGWTGFFMVVPYLLFFSAFSLLPILYGFRISFYEWTLIGERKFVGLHNYASLFTDEEFLSNTWHTVMFAMVSVPLLSALGLFLALLANGLVRGQTLFRAAVFLPMLLSVSVISSIWVIFLQPYTGLISQVLGRLGASEEIYWLSDPVLAWVSIILSTLWWTVGFVFILYLAGLQDIPATHYEAAKMEGASRLESFRYITFPSLSRVTVLVVVLQTISSFKIFGQSKLITQGGPAGSTKTMVFSIYEKGFQYFELGYASAISFVLLLIILLISMLQFTLLRER